MAIFDKWFFIIFNAYYKDGNYKNDFPPFTVMGIISMALFCLTLLIYGIFLVVTDPYYKTEPVKRGPIQFRFVVIAVVYCTITYFLFFRKGRHIRVYDLYKDEEFLRSTTAKIIAWGGVFVVYLSPFVFSIAKNMIIYGRPF